jgi:hypothetical protein
MRNLLAEYTVIYVAREEAISPPYAVLTRDRKEAETAALAWALETFGPGNYEVVAGETVGRAQASRWGTIPFG